MSMTRTEVTRVLRIVFFFWLVLSIALGLTTIVELLPMPDRRHDYEAGSSRVPPGNGDRQTQSFPHAKHSADPTSTITTQTWPGASSRLEYTIPHAFCGGQACSVTLDLQDLVATFDRIAKDDCPWLSRLTSSVLTMQCAVLVPALNFTALRQPKFGMRIACPMIGGKTPC
jgi:hypothetical protein